MSNRIVYRYIQRSGENAEKIGNFLRKGNEGNDSSDNKASYEKKTVVSLTTLTTPTTATVANLNANLNTNSITGNSSTDGISNSNGISNAFTEIGEGQVQSLFWKQFTTTSYAKQYTAILKTHLGVNTTVGIISGVVCGVVVFVVGIILIIVFCCHKRANKTEQQRQNEIYINHRGERIDNAERITDQNASSKNFSGSKKSRKQKQNQSKQPLKGSFAMPTIEENPNSWYGSMNFAENQNSSTGPSENQNEAQKKRVSAKEGAKKVLAGIKINAVANTNPVLKDGLTADGTELDASIMGDIMGDLSKEDANASITKGLIKSGKDPNASVSNSILRPDDEAPLDMGILGDISTANSSKGMEEVPSDYNMSHIPEDYDMSTGEGRQSAGEAHAGGDPEVMRSYMSLVDYQDDVQHDEQDGNKNEKPQPSGKNYVAKPKANAVSKPVNAAQVRGPSPGAIPSNRSIPVGQPHSRFTPTPSTQAVTHPGQTTGRTPSVVKGQKEITNKVLHAHGHGTHGHKAIHGMAHSPFSEHGKNGSPHQVFKNKNEGQVRMHQEALD